MGLRDRFYTPTTAKAILSWRILAGLALAGGLLLLSVNPIVAVGAGILAYAGLVAAAMPRSKKVRIDAFTVHEPWRRFVQEAQRSVRTLNDTIAQTDDGPIKQRLQSIAQRVDSGLDDTWRIAQRGDEIDRTVRRLDPTRLRSKLSSLRAAGDSDDAVASVESQLATIERLKQQSGLTAGRLREACTRLDELAAQAAEVSIGVGDTDDYEHEIDTVVDELVGLRLAVEETRTA